MTQIFNGDLAALPAAIQPLTSHKRWIVWKLEKTKSGKSTKVPYRANDPSKKARSNEPATWSDYATALAAFQAGKADGIGYVLTDGDIGAIDLDKCVNTNTGAIAPWAKELIGETDSYVEVTVSGTGLRIIGTAEGDNIDKSVATPDGGEVEFYRRGARYITISGLQFGDCAELQSIDGLIDHSYERFAGQAVPRGLSHSRMRSRTRSSPPSPSMQEMFEQHAGKGISTDPDDLVDFELYVRAINLIPNPDLTWGEWKRIIMTIWAAFLGSADGLAAAHAWSRKSDKYDAAGTNQAWDEVTGSPPSDLSAGTLIWEADQAEPGWRDEAELDDAEPSADADETTDEPAKADAWPTMDEAAYHGIIGEVVRTIEPETEADPVAILIQLLIAIGSMIGRQVYYQVESDRHHANLFAAAVGETSKARKGTAWGRVREVAYHADPEWVLHHVGSGLSSGEGLIHQVRDRVTKINKDGEEEIVDHGVSDKRFMALEAELSGLLKVMERPGNTISPLFRKAWDGGDLQTLTRNNALRATDPHVSMVGHITIDEIRSCLTRTDAANGFANRILFVLARRSKELPMGGNLDERVIQDLGGRIGHVINDIGFRIQNDARSVRVRFSPAGEQRWREAYGHLTKGHPGLFGAVTARGEAQAIRLALIYATMDESDVIDLPHIEAGLAVWDYCERSARHIFGEMLGDNVADTILTGLKQMHPGGMTRTEIYRDLFGGHARSSDIAAALARLKALCLVASEVTGAGTFGRRPTEVWTYTPH
jgi:hypothetical protein